MRFLNREKFAIICCFVILLPTAIISIIYASKIIPNLRVRLPLKAHNEKFFVNFENEKISVLKSSHYFDNRRIKENSKYLKEIGPIPTGKLISYFDGKEDCIHGYWKPYLAMGKRAVYYAEKKPVRYNNGELVRDIWGQIEYEMIPKVKYIDTPYWDEQWITLPYNYTYTFSVFDLSDSISSNAPDSVYSNYTKRFAKQLASYEKWIISPNELKCKRNENWAKYYKSVLPMKKEAVAFQTLDPKGVSVIRLVYFANRKAYVLDVHSPYELTENANKIMDDFTTFYLQDYNDMVSMQLLLFILCCLAFILLVVICFFMQKSILRNKGISLPKSARCLQCYIYISWFVNIICVFADIYPIFTGYLRQDSYWWSVFILFLFSVCMNVFTSMYIANKVKTEHNFDYLIPKWLKFYLSKRHITDAEYKSVIVFLIYPFFLLSNLPFGICCLAYILPVTIVSIILIELRNFSKWTYADTKHNNPDGIEEFGVFKDYYLLLDANRNASEEDLYNAFNKAMAKYHLGIDSDLYNETYKRNIQEAYCVLSSTNRLRPEYDKEFEEYRKSNSMDYQFSDVNTQKDIMFIQRELLGKYNSVNYSTRKSKTYNAILVAFLSVLTLTFISVLLYFCLHSSQYSRKKIVYPISVPSEDFSIDDYFGFTEKDLNW